MLSIETSEYLEAQLEALRLEKLKPVNRFIMACDGARIEHPSLDAVEGKSSTARDIEIKG